jgi:hypothetical protein
VTPQVASEADPQVASVIDPQVVRGGGFAWRKHVRACCNIFAAGAGVASLLYCARALVSALLFSFGSMYHSNLFSPFILQQLSEPDENRRMKDTVNIVTGAILGFIPSLALLRFFKSHTNKVADNLEYDIFRKSRILEWKLDWNKIDLEYKMACYEIDPKDKKYGLEYKMEKMMDMIRTLRYDVAFLQGAFSVR